jgi:DNA replication and repair protein RecF
VELEPGLVLVTGPNGAGKTNLLEAIHVGTQGFSPRTRADAQLVRRGSERARIALAGSRGGVPTATEVELGLHTAKRARLNGAVVRSAEQLRTEIATLVFTPDRLAVVKGGPAARRAYFDRVLGRLLPARSALPVEYGTALGQRNAALRRLAAGVSSRDALDPWTEQVSELGASLVEARREAVALLAPGFEARASELGLPAGELVYDGEAATVEELEARLERDLERGATGAGPHLHDVAVRSGDRDLRAFGSQGEQRLAVLALLLSEAELLCAHGDVAPLLLLDDALSELDGDRRRVLSERLGVSGQTIVTATGAEALPLAPAQLLTVSPGEVRPG